MCGPPQAHENSASSIFSREGFEGLTAGLLMARPPNAINRRAPACGEGPSHGPRLQLSSLA